MQDLDFFPTSSCGLPKTKSSASRLSIRTEWRAKVQLFRGLKKIEARLNDKSAVLKSFVISPSAIGDLADKHSKAAWRENHVLFMAGDYVKELVEKILQTEKAA